MLVYIRSLVKSFVILKIIWKESIYSARLLFYFQAACIVWFLIKFCGQIEKKMPLIVYI